MSGRTLSHTMTAVKLLLLLLAGTGALRLPLYGNYSSTFFWWTSVAVGGVPFTVTVDTGSSDLLVPALGCTGCIGGDPATYLNASRAALPCPPLPELLCTCAGGALCVFNVTYGGSLTLEAVGVHDTLTVAGLTTQVRLGATYNVLQPPVLRASPRRAGLQRLRARLSTRDLGQYPEGMWGLAFRYSNNHQQPPLLTPVAAR